MKCRASALDNPRISRVAVTESSGSKPRPISVLQPVDIMADSGPAGFDPAVTLLHMRFEIEIDFSVVGVLDAWCLDNTDPNVTSDWIQSFLYHCTTNRDGWVVTWVSDQNDRS